MCSRRPHYRLDVNQCAPEDHIIDLMWTHVLMWSSGAHGFTSNLWCGLMEHMGSHQVYDVVFWSTWIHIKSIMWSSRAHGFTSNLWCSLMEHMGWHQVYDVVFWCTWVHIKSLMWTHVLQKGPQNITHQSPNKQHRPHYRFDVNPCAP
jgi:hypothetical protein